MAKGIVVKCENCGKQLKTTRKMAGKRGRCPHCGSVLRIGRPSEGAAEGAVERKVQMEKVEAGPGALLELTKHNGVGVVSFRTSRILDQSNVQQLGDEFSDLFRVHKLRKIVLNFKNVHYMSSAVMGKLVSLHKQLEEAGGELRLCHIADSIYEIFKIMRFDRLFKIVATEDDAVIELIS
jgi:anti-sigma B factor antagonist